MNYSVCTNPQLQQIKRWKSRLNSTAAVVRLLQHVRAFPAHGKLTPLIQFPRHSRPCVPSCTPSTKISVTPYFPAPIRPDLQFISPHTPHLQHVSAICARDHDGCVGFSLLDRKIPASDQKNPRFRLTSQPLRQPSAASLIPFKNSSCFSTIAQRDRRAI